MGRRKRTYSSSSSCSDDIPLLRLKGPDLTAALYMYRQENCQLCDKICHNKYEYLVHNANHIIIPLFRGSIPHCLPCKKYFTTVETLQLHNDKHHKIVPDILESIINNKPVVKCDSSVNDLIRINNEQKLNDIISKEVVVRCDDNLSELLRATYKRDYQGDEEPMECDSTVNEPYVDGKVESATSTVEDMVYEIEDSDEDTKVTSNIKSRLVFEDDNYDVEDDIIQLPQIGSYMGINNYNLVQGLPDDSDNNGNKDGETNKQCMILGTKVVYTPSVHYDNLTVPGKHKCMRCSKSFENRFELIQHEKTHLKFRLRHPMLCTYCDKYIAGNHYSLRDHINRKHDEVSGRRLPRIENCKKCGLKYYSIFKHMMNYHRIYVCPLCEHRFEDKSERDAHVPACKGPDDSARHKVEYSTEVVKVIKICELCSLFCKTSHNSKYVHLGEFSKEGERVTCERCEKKFFEVKLMKMITKLKEQRQEKKKLVNTNANRLKNIQQRLKMLSKLNKW
ncbi:zinc finger protein 131-like [Pectinophora gossypiella]|uniref:C2H2-type domain-containing protein n=1 Tax=Pectinophora gossypiella TaxID=13191 RepID=A0A1E1WB35_PECGO|nr:zinc finger protein 131-like [Pectinophora gossypiella]XP_049883351.1 zinc finger protein 131-like [Pectinophora gossypiella]